MRSSDGALILDLAIPKELGGPGGVATNPEQLFAAGYAACYENAVRHAARRRKVRLGDTFVTARMGIGPNDAGGFELTVELHVRVSELEPEQAREIAEDAHLVYPYSNALRGNVNVTIVMDPEPNMI